MKLGVSRQNCPCPQADVAPASVHNRIRIQAGLAKHEGSAAPSRKSLTVIA